MTFLQKYLTPINQYIEDNPFIQQPVELYEPLNYFMNIGGKRVRPVMALMAYSLFKKDFETIIKPALALEYFHNFTLIHDDIMDDADLRRNQETIHQKYNINTAILSGDALLIKAYGMFSHLSPNLFKDSLELFSKTALEVCEGQQMDMNFETMENVSFEDYLSMIIGKTAVLGACAFQLGGLLAKASSENQALLYQFGKHLGIAFQLRDDYLDVFGEMEKVGKTQAGDILENKKTALYFFALKNANELQKSELLKAYKITNPEEKIKKITDLFIQTKADQSTLDLIHTETKIAYDYLSKINANTTELEQLAQYLLERES